MPKLLQNPLYNRTSGENVAIIEACGRVFAASLARDGDASPSRRDETAANSVTAFLEALAKD